MPRVTSSCRVIAPGKIVEGATLRESNAHLDTLLEASACKGTLPDGAGFACVADRGERRDAVDAREILRRAPQASCELITPGGSMRGARAFE